MKKFDAKWLLSILAFGFMLGAFQATIFGQDLSETTKGLKVSELQWLAGTWWPKDPAGETDEHWIEPKGGMMLGLNRTVTASGQTSFEFMRIAETSDGICFFASPSGKPATKFPLIELKDQQVTFENKEHDFPQKIVYQRVDDVLNGRIEGVINGKTQKMEWNWCLKK